MAKPAGSPKKLPPWMTPTPKRSLRQTEIKTRQTAKASGLKAKRGPK